MSQDCSVPKGVWFQTVLFAGVSHSPWFLSQQVGVESSKVASHRTLEPSLAGEGWSEHRRHHTSPGLAFLTQPWGIQKEFSIDRPFSTLQAQGICIFPEIQTPFLSWSEHCLSSVTHHGTAQGCTETKLSLTWWICTTLHPQLKQLIKEINDKYIRFGCLWVFRGFVVVVCFGFLLVFFVILLLLLFFGGFFLFFLRLRRGFLGFLTRIVGLGQYKVGDCTLRSLCLAQSMELD